MKTEINQLFLNQKQELLLSHKRDEKKLQTYFARQDYARFLMLAIQMKKNTLIAGATSTGKTTQLTSTLPTIPLTITVEPLNPFSLKESSKSEVSVFYYANAKDASL